MKTNLLRFTMASRPGFGQISGRNFVQPITRAVAGLLLAGLTLAASTSYASDPIGIYALVDKVVLEPNESNPERIQIWGAFAFAAGYDYAYEKPQRGFLYYKLNTSKKETCLKEWADLKSMAGTNQVVGFAARHRDKGALRKAEDKPVNPDPYPLGFGVTKIRDTDYEPVRELLKLSKSKDPKKAPTDKKTPAAPKGKDRGDRSVFGGATATKLGY